MKVALDTNVLVSAAISDGPPRRILEVAAEGLIELVVPELALAELERVLGEKLGLDPEVFRRIRELLEELPIAVIAAPVDVDPLSGDGSDDRILAAAVAAGAGVLITGDRKHLLPLDEVAGVRLVRPQDFLAGLTS